MLFNYMNVIQFDAVENTTVIKKFLAVVITLSLSLSAAVETAINLDVIPTNAAARSN